MPHMLLLGGYFLYIGRERRWAMYLSMVFFGMAPYAYGLAAFSVPVILLCLAVYYWARRKANVADLVVCVAVFFAVAGPYFITMAINAFSLETIEFGPMTMPLFEKSHRTNDMPFFQINPYSAFLANLLGHLNATVLGGPAEPYNAIGWAHVMYRFMIPLYLYAVYKMWRSRRQMVINNVDSAERDGMMILLVWLFAALVSGLMIGGVVNRNNAIFYPMIMLCAYGLYLMGKRLRTAMALMLVMLTVSFAALNVTYFTDEKYQKVFFDGIVEALEDTWDWDYDEVYVSAEDSGASRKFTEAAIMFAHKIDYEGRSEQVELMNAQGEPTGWYFTERYHLVNMEEFEPDPMACAVYIVKKAEAGCFDEELYLLTDYGDYTVAYPRYWAE